MKCTAGNTQALGWSDRISSCNKANNSWNRKQNYAGTAFCFSQAKLPARHTFITAKYYFCRINIAV